MSVHWVIGANNGQVEMPILLRFPMINLPLHMSLMVAVTVAPQ